MMFFNVGFTVFASCVLVAVTSVSTAGVRAVSAASIAALLVVTLRIFLPAQVESPEAEEKVGDDEPDGGWDLSGFLLASVVIPVVMILGFLVHGWLMVLIVLGIAATTANATLGGVLVAIAVSITASVCAEYAIVHPLFARWDIALD